MYRSSTTGNDGVTIRVDKLPLRSWSTRWAMGASGRERERERENDVCACCFLAAIFGAGYYYQYAVGE